MGALVLDLLLLIIFLMMIPIGFYRGGLRELCTSAGLLLGILMAHEWGERWSSAFVKIFHMTEGGAVFAMSASIAFLITALIGYGGSASFSWIPGPGAKVYGAFLALMNGMIATGFLIQLYTDNILRATTGEPVTRGIIARTLNEGFGWVLLAATIGVGIATAFGMFVRDRSVDLQTPEPVAPLYQQPVETRPYRVQDEEPAPRRTEPTVRVLEAPDTPSPDREKRKDESTAAYGSGWRQTWPGSATARKTPRARESRSKETIDAADPADAVTKHGKDVLADWVKDQE